MRLLRLQDAEIGPRDRVFRHSRMRALIAWLAGFVTMQNLEYGLRPRCRHSPAGCLPD